MASIKTFAKSLMSRSFSARSLSDSTDVIKSASVVSFDVFDTLVYRLCNGPEDLYDFVERLYLNSHPASKHIHFREKRIQAERIARELSDSEEVTFFDIYKMLAKLDEDIPCEELADLELKTELLLCRANPDVLPLYELTRDLGKTIILTTDMYLPRSAIEAILESCGYAGWSELFLSSETGLTKRSGNQFQHVLERLSVNSSEVVHIGDHPVSDYLHAKDHGMQALQVSKKAGYRRVGSFWKRRSISRDANPDAVCLMRNIAASVFQNEQDIFEIVGGQVLGPMLVGYASWLHALVKEEDAEEIWFLSREGRVLREAYLHLYGCDAAANRYVSVSRLAIARACLCDAKSTEDVFGLFSTLISGIETVGEFLSLLGLQEEDAKQLLLQFGEDSPLAAIERNPSFYSALMKVGGSTFAEQNQMLVDYLDSAGHPKKVVISDIGWAGTMQAFIQKLLPDTHFIGAYLAVSNFHDSDHASLIDRKGLDRRGYWCNSEEWPERGLPIRFTQSACEELYLSTEGTVVSYETVGGEVRPVKRRSENSSVIVSAINRMHNSAIELVDSAKRAGITSFFDSIDSSVALLPYLNFAVYPKKETLSFFENLMFIDGTKHVGFLPTRRIFYYLFHPHAATQELEKNNCKVIWLYGLIRLPFPYLKTLILLSSAGLKSEYRKRIEQSS